MSLVIFGDVFSFPDGSAATNRVYTYANGFIENGVKVHVICFSNDYVQKNEGVINRIQYYHPYAQQQRHPNFFVRNWRKLVKYYIAYLIIKKINRTDQITAINSCSNFLTTHIFGWLLARVSQSKLIVECNEHPLRHYQGSWLRQRIGKLNFTIEAAVSDGVFCISHYLMDFYRSTGFNDKKLFLVPSTVNPTRFTSSGQRPVSYKYIGYFGSLTFGRDNIDLLINAFSTFSKNHPEVHLVLGGYCPEEDRKKLISLVDQSGIQARVLLLGYLTREEIINYVSHAEILVMVRRDDLESRASYPSKLTEYIASARPVITVKVGEVPLYLKDGVDVFMVEPGNVNALVQKLEYVYNHPEEAALVGRKGQQLTENVFNYKYQAKRMIGFISSLYNTALPATSVKSTKQPVTESVNGY